MRDGENTKQLFGRPNAWRHWIAVWYLRCDGELSSKRILLTASVNTFGGSFPPSETFGLIIVRKISLFLWRFFFRSLQGRALAEEERSEPFSQEP